MPFDYPVNIWQLNTAVSNSAIKQQIEVLVGFIGVNFYKAARLEPMETFPTVHMTPRGQKRQTGSSMVT